MCHLTEYTLSAPPFPMKGTFCKVCIQVLSQRPRGKSLYKFLQHEANRNRASWRWLGLESSPLTIRPPHITLGHYACWKYTFIHEFPYPSIQGGDMKTAQYITYQQVTFLLLNWLKNILGHYPTMANIKLLHVESNVHNFCQTYALVNGCLFFDGHWL